MKSRKLPIQSGFTGGVPFAGTATSLFQQQRELIFCISSSHPVFTLLLHNSLCLLPVVFCHGPIKPAFVGWSMEVFRKTNQLASSKQSFFSGRRLSLECFRDVDSLDPIEIGSLPLDWAIRSKCVKKSVEPCWGGTDADRLNEWD